MRNITITARRQKIELWTLLACLVIANVVNLYAILKYDASLMEILTSFCYILVFTLALYVAWTLIRVVLYAIWAILKGIYLSIYRAIMKQKKQ